MNHGSLFSGIGGFDLAAEWMGWNNIFHCEWNPFGQKVLNYYWPKAKAYHDITKTEFTIHRGQIDILTGGFPCQPYSQAGKRLGKEDDRHLWPEMLRAIREIQPQFIVGENVSGLVNWNGGMVFEEVQTELENEGYEVTPFLLPASGVNAPHQRERVWFIAYSDHARTNIRSGVNEEWKEKDKGWKEFPQSEFGKRCSDGITSDTTSIGGTQNFRERESRFFNEESKINDWQDFPTQSPICDGNDGISSRLDGITFSKWRNESIKAGGNAIVPQVALQIFKAIEKFQDL